MFNNINITINYLGSFFAKVLMSCIVVKLPIHKIVKTFKNFRLFTYRFSSHKLLISVFFTGCHLTHISLLFIFFFYYYFLIYYYIM